MATRETRRGILLNKMIRALVVLATVGLIHSPVHADERWDEYISNSQSVGNTSTDFTFGFKASEIIVDNSGAQSCYVRFKSGSATTADKSMVAGSKVEFRYSGTDIGNGAGVPSIRVICPSTSTVNVWAIRPY